VRVIKNRLLTLSLLGCSLLASLPAQAQSNPNDAFSQLVNQPDYRARYQNRIEQELKRWQGTRPDQTLFDDARMVFNLRPRDRMLRPAMTRLLTARKPQPGHPQDEELYYYLLLNLEPRSEVYRQKLAELLYRKHGGHTAAEVKNAYKLLNDGFNVWDEAKYDQALRLFRQSLLPRSAELTALMASHLRDRGKVDEALSLLEGFKGDKSYLGWVDGLQAQMRSARQVLNSSLPENERVPAYLTLGQLNLADEAIKRLPDGPMKHWYRGKLLEKQGQYHDASAAYQSYYHQLWSGQLKGFVPVVYKAQLEDINSLDLIALKFRTTPEMIRLVNQSWPHDWVETYRMLVIPVASHELHWPTTGYVSSHFGFRLHPIRGTWRLHEGIDIETKPGVQALAAGTGSVMQAGYDQACGNMIRLQHPEPSLRTVYCHGEKLLVRKDARVEAGKPVLVTGNTGASASNHLHFGVQLNGVFTDPMDWL
jgi:murein DD-endopeptidase MepM/ murein hydrolase activator NlpD